MKLSSADVIRLYGQRLFILPDQQATEAAEASSDSIHPTPSEPAPPSAPEPAPKPVPTEKVDVKPALVEETALDPSVVSGQKVQWKMKAQARIALVMDEASFKNRALTVGLKDCVVRAGVSTNLIGFGILPAGAPPADFRDQPVPVAIVFASDFGQGDPIILTEEKILWRQPSVAGLILDAAKQESLINLLKQIATQFS